MSAVLHICEYAAAYKGNFVHSLLKLEEFLKPKGIEQIYVFPERAQTGAAKCWLNELMAAGCTVYTIPQSLSGSIKLLQKIKKQHNIKTVFRHFASNTSDIAAWLVFGGKNTIRFFHGIYSASTKSPKHILRQIIYKNNTLVGVSQAVSNGLTELFPKHRVTTINNAIDFARLDKPGKFQPKPGINCLAMGYNIRLKGADLALDAIAEINKKSSVNLYILAASHTDELNSLIAKKFIESPAWLSVLPPDENIATYYKCMDIFLAPSRSEGFSYAAVESAYCELPIVLSDIPAHKLLKIDGRYFFKSEDILDCAEKLSKAIAEIGSEESTRILSESKNAVVQHYSMDNWCEQIYKLL